MKAVHTSLLLAIDLNIRKMLFCDSSVRSEEISLRGVTAGQERNQIFPLFIETPTMVKTVDMERARARKSTYGVGDSGASQSLVSCVRNDIGSTNSII